MYKKGIYKSLTEKEILEKIKEKGFDPQKITDAPNYVYEPHQHPETKLLVFLDGKMTVEVKGKTFICSKGDELIIPGNTEHSAVVGKDGCTFFWSEKII